MRFGAPPHLLDRAQQATRDEIRHVAFSIAQAFCKKMYSHRNWTTHLFCVRT